MEIHAPDHPIHTRKDFFIHLFTITVGLLIALSLEGLVEYAHHRHLVHQARENIRRECEENHLAAQHNLSMLAANVARQKANIAAIHGLMTQPDYKGSITNTMDIDGLSDAAWRTARDSGALSYMPYDEVERYSDLYIVEALVNDTSVGIAKDDFLAAAPFAMGYEANKLPLADYDRLLHDNAAIEIRLSALRQIIQQYDDTLTAELKR